MQETITEATVELIDGVRVGMGNMVQGSYTTPDGQEKKGWICSLALPGQTGVFVGAGSELEIGGKRWSVIKVLKEKNRPGSVTLERHV
jgi:hypothetical protein